MKIYEKIVMLRIIIAASMVTFCTIVGSLIYFNVEGIFMIAKVVTNEVAGVAIMLYLLIFCTAIFGLMAYSCFHIARTAMKDLHKAHRKERKNEN